MRAGLGLVGLLALFSTGAGAVESPPPYLPVAVTCPSANNPVLQLIAQNVRGETERLEVSYDVAMAVTKIRLYFLDKSGNTQLLVSNTTVQTDGDPSHKGFIDLQSAAAQKAIGELCNVSPAERSAKLNANLKTIGAVH